MKQCYALVDPRSKLVHYVGQSKHPEKRIQEHYASVALAIKLIDKFGLEYAKRCSTPKEVWILELRLLGLRPELQVLPDVFTESGWIAYFLESSHPVLNACPVGGGWRGFKLPAFKHPGYWVR